MTLNKTERFIKQKMQSYEADVDTGKLMNALNDHLPQKRKKPYPLWIFFVFAFLLLGAGAVYYTNVITEQETGKEMVSSFLPKPFKGEAHEIIPENSRENIKVLKTETVKGKETQNSKSDKNNVTKNIEGSSRSHQSTFEINASQIEKAQNAINESTKNAFPNEGISSNPVTPKSNEKHIYTINFVERRIPFIIPIRSKDSFDLKVVQILKPVLCGRKAYAVYFGMGAGMSDLKFSTEDIETQDFADDVNNISESKNAFTMELGTNIYLSKNIYFNTGLELRQLVTRFHPKWQKTEEEKNNSASGGSQTITHENSYEAIGHNYHYLFDLPLGLGMELYRSCSFNVAIQSTLAFNYYRESHGYRIDTDQKLLAYDAPESDPYKNPLGFSFSASLPIHYVFNDRWQLMIKPEYRNRKLEFDHSILKLKEHYHSFYLTLGAKYEF